MHVNDIVRSILKCFKNNRAKGNIINIGTGKPKNVRKNYKFYTKKIQTGYPQFGKIKLRKDEILKVYPKISKAKKILKWRPKIKFENGLISTIRWYQNAR